MERVIAYLWLRESIIMNPAITAALIAAAHKEETEEAIIGRLRKGKAISPSSAISLDLPDDKRGALDQAIAGGTVVKTADGHFYLNERALADRNDSQGYMALLMILIAGSVIASGVAIFAFAN